METMVDRSHHRVACRNLGGELVVALTNACEKLIVLDAFVKIETFTSSKRFN